MSFQLNNVPFADAKPNASGVYRCNFEGNVCAVTSDTTPLTATSVMTGTNIYGNVSFFADEAYFFNHFIKSD